MASSPRPAMPRTVWALGLVSLLMDMSSESIHALLPLFLTTVLGANVAAVGTIDGIAEATASISKVFSGYISDRIGRRKPLIFLGYALGAASKPLFPLATSPATVLAARFCDRIGKGIRGAPRDALIADVTPPAIRGRAFGLRQALDTAGAFIGPAAGIGLMFLFANDMRAVFWVAAIPAVLSAACVLFWVEDRRIEDDGRTPAPIRLRELAMLPRAFWMLVGIAVVLTLARFSEAFLILDASGEGLPTALAPLVLIVMNAIYSLAAYPAGILADRLPVRTMLTLGLGFLVAADALLAASRGLVLTFFGIACWGLHMAMTQGLLAKLVADCAPARLVGSAFGLFNIATGLALLLASVIAGVVWDAYGAAATFLCGGGFAALAAVLLVFHRGPAAAAI